MKGKQYIEINVSKIRNKKEGIIVDMYGVYPSLLGALLFSRLQSIGKALKRMYLCSCKTGKGRKCLALNFFNHRCINTSYTLLLLLRRETKTPLQTNENRIN